MWAVLRYKKTIKNKGYGFFFTYVRCEIFYLFDRLTLLSILEHFAFCTRTYDSSGFCFTCSRVYFKDTSAYQLRLNIILRVHLWNPVGRDLGKMF